MRNRVAAAVCVLAIVAGVAAAIEVGWQYWGTDLVAAQAQDDASGELDQQWRNDIPEPVGAAPIGTPIARLDIPRLGSDWTRVLFEGVDQDTLAKGPGHYPGAGQIGEPGNYAIAGHRVGRGAPFDGAADIRPCDPITVTTQAAVYTYLVLPYAGLPAPCALPDLAGVPGQEIVSPDDVDVITASPDGSRASGRSLLTITTCHPRYSARQRLVIHAVLVSSARRLRNYGGTEARRS